MTCDNIGPKSCLTCDSKLNRVFSNNQCICNPQSIEDNGNAACKVVIVQPPPSPIPEKDRKKYLILKIQFFKNLFSKIILK